MSMSSEFTSSAERGGTRDAKGSKLVMARRCPAVVPALWKCSSKKVDTSESVWDACAPSQPQTHSESLSQKSNSKIEQNKTARGKISRREREHQRCDLCRAKTLSKAESQTINSMRGLSSGVL